MGNLIQTLKSKSEFTGVNTISTPSPIYPNTPILCSLCCKWLFTCWMSRLSVVCDTSPSSVHICICTVKKLFIMFIILLQLQFIIFICFRNIETSITMNSCLRWTILLSNTCNIHRIWQLTVRYQLQKQTVRPFASYVVDRRTKRTCVFTVNSSYKEVCGLYVCLHVCHTHAIWVHSILNTFTHGVNSCM